MASRLQPRAHRLQAPTQSSPPPGSNPELTASRLRPLLRAQYAGTGRSEAPPPTACTSEAVPRRGLTGGAPLTSHLATPLSLCRYAVGFEPMHGYLVNQRQDLALQF